MMHDDYLRCGEYFNKPAHPKEPGFVTFYVESMDRYFFALMENNNRVLLRSEAYESEKARENGIQAVKKNLALEERYVVKKEEGFYYLILRAGNRKEIARSCESETVAQAKALMQKLLAGNFERITSPAEAAEEQPKAEKAPAQKKTAKKDAAPAPAADHNDRTAAPERSFTAAYSSMHMEYTDPETGVEYPALDHYYGHATLHDEFGRTGYAVFSGADGKHYFAVYNADGSIYLRSSGFATAEERDQQLTETRRFIIHPDHYRVVEAGDKYAVALVNDQENELARSGLFDSFTEAFSKTPAAHQTPGSGNVY